MKYFLLLIALFCSSTIIAKAQTKEETIKWIIEKINLYGRSTIYSGNIETQYFEKADIGGISREFCVGTDADYKHCEIFLDSKIQFYNITNVRFFNLNNSPYTPSIMLSGTDIENLVTGGTYPSHWQTNFEVRLDWDAEPDLLNRMFKAFQKLISFDKPKEAF